MRGPGNQRIRLAEHSINREQERAEKYMKNDGKGYCQSYKDQEIKKPLDII